MNYIYALYQPLLDFCSSIPIYFLWKKSLFDRNNQYNCYSKIFTNLILDNEEELAILDISPHDLSTHSARKSIGTLIAAECTLSPPIVSLYLRMQGSIHGMLERYFKLAKADDIAVRHKANLNNPLMKQYNVSSYYFDYTYIDDEVEREARKNEINEFLNA